MNDYFPFRTAKYRSDLVNNKWLNDIEISVLIPREKELPQYVYDLQGNIQDINIIKKGTIYIYEGRVFIKQ